MKVSFVGDIHGDEKYYNKLIPNSIQIGDFDLFGYDKYEECIESWILSEKELEKETGPRYFIDGNHDNFNKLDPNVDTPYEIVKNLIYIPRGYVNGKVMFIGGGDSPPFDRRHRTEGHSWFREESISQNQYSKIIDKKDEIEVMITHDCPCFVAEKVLRENLGNYYKYNLPMPKALTEFFNKFKPKLWIFGHYHFKFDKVIKGCRFVCLDIGELKEFDIPLKTFPLGKA